MNMYWFSNEWHNPGESKWVTMRIDGSDRTGAFYSKFADIEMGACPTVVLLIGVYDE